MGQSFSTHFVSKGNYIEAKADLRSTDSGSDIAVLSFKSDDWDMNIHFKDAEQFALFCKEHNFNYVDERTKIAKRYDFSTPLCCPQEIVGPDVAYWQKGCEAFKKYVEHDIEINREKIMPSRLDAFNRGVADMERMLNQTSEAEEFNAAD